MSTSAASTIPRSASGALVCSRTLFERTIEMFFPRLASTSQERSRSVLKNHLKPEFGDLMLREITLEALQGYFTRLQQSKLSYESIDKIRDVLSAVLRTAVEYGRLLNNPAEKVRLKRRKGERPQTVSADRAVLSSAGSDRGAVRHHGLRGGVYGPQGQRTGWPEVAEHPYHLDYHRGAVQPWRFRSAQIQASRATIPVDAHVIARIERLKSLEVLVRAGYATRRYRVVKSDAPDDLVFQSVAKGAPMRDNNILTRHIKPTARKLNLGWVNWQVLRRSCATWLQQAGVDVKDAQGIMRHSRASTTQDVYQQLVPESQRRAVQKLTSYVETGRVVQ